MRNQKRILYRRKRSGAFDRKIYGKGSSYKDFSLVEDEKDAYFVIEEMVQNAGRIAVAEAKAKNLPLTYARENDVLVQITPDGKEVILKPLIRKSNFYINHKLPNTLNASKK